MRCAIAEKRKLFLLFPALKDAAHFWRKSLLDKHLRHSAKVLSGNALYTPAADANFGVRYSEQLSSVASLA